MMTFDRVLPELLRVCESSGFAAKSYCVVRDVRGRVRLIVEPSSEDTLDKSQLEQKLQTVLGKFFVGPVLSSNDGGELGRLARTLLEKAKGVWPNGWPQAYTDVVGALTDVSIANRWSGIERTIGKEEWLSTEAEPTWKLKGDKTPAIVTLHSFKGGVARSTLAAAYAIYCATQKRRVAVVDLDLEAPGAGHLLATTTTRGVLDVLIDHITTKALDLTDAKGHSGIDSAIDEKITVYPAGELSDTYLQKLARLDFSSATPGDGNPVEGAMRSLLKKIKNENDVIVLDSRAGLHDLAGMSLHNLAHVDVLVFRGTKQHIAGLEQTVKTLGVRNPKPLVLVETFLPSTDPELFDLRKKKTGSVVYNLLLAHYYGDQGDDAPQLEDTGLAHDVLCVRHKDWLDSLDSMAGSVDRVLKDEEFQSFFKRVDEAIALAREAVDEDGEVEG